MTLSSLLAPGTRPRLLADGFTWTEGPVWVAELDSFVFSDIPQNKSFRWNVESNELSVFANPSDYANGRTRDLNGDLIECSNAHRALIRRPLESTCPPTTVVSKVSGHRLNSPNDVVVARDGSIWFTDPAYGIEIPGEGPSLGSREYGDRWVFRFDPGTGELRPVITSVIAPNGLAFSPDENHLYVVDSSASGGEGGPGHHIWRFDMYQGLPKSGVPFATIECEVPDGIRVDVAGNVWSSAGDGVWVFASTGTAVGHIPFPQRVANLCWGGSDGHTLFVCATNAIHSVETLTTDATWETHLRR